jgi:hypothetical protein
VVVAGASLGERPGGAVGAQGPHRTDGSRLTWEYPLESPDGDRMDLVEVMEIRDGLIAHHRVYWGWVGVGTLTSGEHPR